MTKVNIPYIMEINTNDKDSFLVRKDAKTNTYDKALFIGFYVNYDDIKQIRLRYNRLYKKNDLPKDSTYKIDNTDKRVFDSCITNYYKVSNVLKALNITYNMNSRISNFQKK